MLSTAFAADTGLSASSLKVKLYKFAVSTSPLCTNLITVIDNGATPVDTQLLGGANLGSGTLANGTYPCVVIEMDDAIKYIPAANSTSGNCLTSAETTRTLCHNGDTSELVDGTVTNCVTGAVDKVAMYISTATSGNNGDGFNKPTSIGDTLHGSNLPSALVVSGDTSATMMVSTAGQLCDYNLAGCDGSPGGGGVVAGGCRLEGADITFED